MIKKDEVIIKELYIKLCEASISKNVDILNEILSDDYKLYHMTGKVQTKTEYIESVVKGELKYFDVQHDCIYVEINDNNATLIGKTKTLASPFGIGKSWWNLQQDIKLKKINDKWLIIESKASSY